DLVGRNAFDLIHPHDLQDVLTAFKGELNAGNSQQEAVEYRFRHRDGSWRHLESIGKNMVNDPHVRGIVVNSRDITERKRAEERIHEQAALLDKATDAIMTLTLEGDITFWNLGAERLYGWRNDEVVKRFLEA